MGKLFKIKVLQSTVWFFGGMPSSYPQGERTAPLQVCHELINAGYAEVIEELPELPKKEVEPEPPKDGELPLDFPMRDLLIENKLTTLAEVKEFGDLTSIGGIGPAKATEIAEALK